MPPNIVLFLTDQQRPDTLGCYGNPVVQTPHLDQLAESGVRFERAYCPSPLCTPSRASIWSGVLPHRHGLVDLWSDPTNERFGPIPGWPAPSADELPWMGEYFRDAGYETAYVGKWHCLSGGSRRGFEDFITRIGAYDSDDDAQNDWLQHSLAQGYPPPGGKQNGADWQPKGPNYGVSRYREPDHPSSYAYRHAIKFLRQPHDRPFILVISENSPHTPFAPPAPYDTRYRAADIALPTNIHDYASPKRMIEHRGHPRSFRLHREASEEQLQEMWAHYLGMVTHLDDLVGEVLTALDETGLREETAIIFTSDHGEMIGSHRIQDKGAFMFEEVMCVPLIVNWSAQIAPAVYDTPVTLLSLLPTLLDIAQISPRARLDGSSLHASFLAQAAPPDEPIYAEYNQFFGELYPVRMIRHGRWKYVHYFGPEPELFDLQEDPGEMHNLVHSPEHQQVMQQLRDQLGTWMVANNDPFHIDQAVLPQAPSQAQ